MLLQTLTKVLHRFRVYWEMEIKGNKIEALFCVGREWGCCLKAMQKHVVIYVSEKINFVFFLMIKNI